MTDNLANIAGIVLAGGRSSRMGRNKALLEYQGRPLVDYMVGLLQQTGLNDVYVSGNLEGYRCFPDSTPFAGPAAAIRDIRSQLADYDGALFVPVDMPFLTEDILRRLLQNKNGSHYEGWPLPLYLPTKTDAGEGASVKQMIATMGVTTLSVGTQEQENFMNLNTPEQWQEAIGQ